MKLFACGLMVLVLVGVAPAAWAGAAEEIAEIGRLRARLLSQGDLDGWMATYADDAVLTSARTPFRIEGKEAIRAYYADILQTYPTRHAVTRQASVRVYNAETAAVTNGYTHVTLVDRNGQTTNLYLRSSITWIKQSGRWLIVDAHGSRLPVSP